MISRSRAALLSGLLVLGSACPSTAQTADGAAGDVFRKAVEAACTAAASAALDDVRATVDPAGSESYGLALVSGILKGGRDTRSVICAYDRRSKRAEIGTPLDLGSAATDALADFPAGGDVASNGTAATLIYPGSADCGQECLAHWTALSPDDQNQLTALPEQVRRTLAEVGHADEPAEIETARAAAQAVIAAAGGRPAGETAPNLAEVVPGDRSCALLRFGYEGEAPGVRSRFPCALDKLAGGGLILKTSGRENFVYQVQMLGSGLAVVGGRNAPAGPPPGGYDLSRPIDATDPNYGNHVGLGIARPDGRLFLVSIDGRGTEETDPSFFQMLVADPPKAE